MRVVGFIGPSGTGKSYRAAWVARERGIEYIIDDGLLIRGNAIVAGTSAKRETTKIASIKRALFTQDSHVEDLQRVFAEHKPESILILGTSDGMVETIAKRLGLNEINDRVYITEVASEFEIKQALSTRKEQGKHVIPVPAFEIKKDFSGYFLDPLRIFKRKGKGSYQLMGEKAVVRPTFSYLGNYTISDFTIYQIVEYTVSKMEGVHKISRFRAENRVDGIYLEMDLILVYGFVIRELLETIKKNVFFELENLTALNVKNFNVFVKSLVPEQKHNSNTQSKRME